LDSEKPVSGAKEVNSMPGIMLAHTPKVAFRGLFSDSTS